MQLSRVETEATEIIMRAQGFGPRRGLKLPWESVNFDNFLKNGEVPLREIDLETPFLKGDEWLIKGTQKENSSNILATILRPWYIHLAETGQIDDSAFNVMRGERKPFLDPFEIQGGNGKAKIVSLEAQIKAKGKQLEPDLCIVITNKYKESRDERPLAIGVRGFEDSLIEDVPIELLTEVAKRVSMVNSRLR